MAEAMVTGMRHPGLWARAEAAGLRPLLKRRLFLPCHVRARPEFPD